MLFRSGHAETLSFHRLTSRSRGARAAVGAALSGGHISIWRSCCGGRVGPVRRLAVVLQGRFRGQIAINGPAVPGLWYCCAMYETVAAYWCTCEKCGHEWLAVVVPPRCAKCKSRRWCSVVQAAAEEVRTAPPVIARKMEHEPDRPDQQPSAPGKASAVSAGQRRNARSEERRVG